MSRGEAPSNRNNFRFERGRVAYDAFYADDKDRLAFEYLRETTQTQWMNAAEASYDCAFNVDANGQIHGVTK